jgi:pyruvate/2-oxoacid:ferredoxin oxidoreductase alpha subunit
VAADHTEDAETVLVACNTMARTLRGVVEERRSRGERVGMINCKLFRPFPREELRQAVGSARKVGVLDRNHSPGSGGIFWQEIATTLRERSDVMVQDYLVGLGGGDVTPQIIGEILDELTSREQACDPIWKEVTV